MHDWQLAANGTSLWTGQWVRFYACRLYCFMIPNMQNSSATCVVLPLSSPLILLEVKKIEEPKKVKEINDMVISISALVLFCRQDNSPDVYSSIRGNENWFHELIFTNIRTPSTR